MKSLRLVYKIKAPVEKVWQALVDAKVIDEWGAGSATMDDQMGTEFKLWGGDIWGKNVEVTPPVTGQAKLVQDWYGGKWERPSLVSFELKEREGETYVVLNQENIPDNEFAAIKEGWDVYYWGPMQDYLERK